MNPFVKFARFFGIIRVKESNNQVRVTGVDGLILRNQFKLMFETDAISKKMFSSITETSFTLNSFFIPDLVYMLTRLRHNPKTTWSLKRTIDKIMHGILTETWFKMSVGEVKPIIDMKRLNRMKWTPMPKQIEFLHLFGDRMPRYGLNGYIIGFGPGGGKALGLEDLIRTPHGWMRNGDMTIGQKIIAPDGSVTEVTGVYPQGEVDMWRVTFEDGRSVECSEDHLWKVRHKNWTRSKAGQENDGWRVVTLHELLWSFVSHGKDYGNRFYVPLPEPEQKPDADLPVDPYLLGVLLGDGHIGKKVLYFSSADEFILNEVRRLIPEENELVSHSSKYAYGIRQKYSENCPKGSSKLLDQIRAMDLGGHRAWEKFIPQKYFDASAAQKLALIQGLMDTDGTVSENGATSMITTSETMAKQIQEIVRSLGGLCKISVRQKSYTHNDEKKLGRVAYQINIRMKDPSSLFRLPRKKEACPKDYQYAGSLRLRIKDIEYVGKKEAQCISVSHPDKLYLTNDYIVTHNTFADLCVAECVIPPSVAEIKIIISPKKALHLVWEKSINGVFKKTPTYWCCDSNEPMPLKNTEYYVFNFEQIDKAVELGKHILASGRQYFVIVDESHNFADYRSNRTQQLVKLQTLSPKIKFLWTSGSPILKHAAELTSFLKCADPRFNYDAERRFRQIYANAPGRANEIFNHRLGLMMAFMVGKEHFSDTKPTVKELPVKLPPSLAKRFLMSSVRDEMKVFIEQRAEFYKKNIRELRRTVDYYMSYHENTLSTSTERSAFKEYQKKLQIIMRAPDRMMTEELAFCKKYERNKLLPSLRPVNRSEFRNALSATKNLKLKVRGEALGTVLAKRRAECAAALGRYCKPDVIIKESLSKTMFFSSSVMSVKVLGTYLTRMGYEPLLVYADTNADLTKNIERFTNDPNVNPICATMQSLSEAVPVIAASTVVLLNRPYRQAHWDQVIARADRLGQIHPVTVIEVTLDTGGEPNVSSTADAILSEIREYMNEIIGPSFAGPDPDERVYLEAINASSEDDKFSPEEYDK